MGIFKVTNRHSDQGDIGVAHAIKWFASNGYAVCVPISEHQDFDLVVVRGSEAAQKVQVKTTRHQTSFGIYEVSLVTRGGNQSWSGTSKYFDECYADIVFAVTDNGDYYLVPREAITSKATLSLGKKMAAFQVW